MTAKIEELANKYPHAVREKRNVPMPTTGYIVREKAKVTKHRKDNRIYGNSRQLNMDTGFTTRHLLRSIISDITWFTKCPIQTTSYGDGRTSYWVPDDDQGHVCP